MCTFGHTSRDPLIHTKNCNAQSKQGGPCHQNLCRCAQPPGLLANNLFQNCRRLIALISSRDPALLGQISRFCGILI